MSLSLHCLPQNDKHLDDDSQGTYCQQWCLYQMMMMMMMMMMTIMIMMITRNSLTAVASLSDDDDDDDNYDYDDHGDDSLGTH